MVDYERELALERAKTAALERELEALRQPKPTPWAPVLAGMTALGLGGALLAGAPPAPVGLATLGLGLGLALTILSRRHS